MATETSTGEPTSPAPAPTDGRRRQVRFAGGIVLAFLLVGIGIGIAGRFGMGYMIGLFGAEQNPTANQYVGIVFLVSIFVYLMAGVLVSGVLGLITGLSFPDRLTSATIAGGATLIGFFLLAFPALIIVVSILGGGGGGGGGGSGPSLPFGAVVKTGLASAVIGALTAAIGSTIGN